MQMGIHPEFYELFLFDCVQMLRKLMPKEQVIREATIYKYWFLLKRPDYLSHPDGKALFMNLRKKGADPNDLESFLDLIESNRPIPAL